MPINNAEFLRTQPQYGGQNWFDIDEAKLSKTMRWIYENQGEAKKVGVKAAKDIAESWTWDHTSAKLHRAIQETYDKINREKNIKEDMNFMEVKSEKSTG